MNRATSCEKCAISAAIHRAERSGDWDEIPSFLTSWERAHLKRYHVRKLCAFLEHDLKLVEWRESEIVREIGEVEAQTTSIKNFNDDLRAERAGH